MKYLDERIIFNIQISQSISDLPEKGVYTYALIRYDIDRQEETVFVGSFYYDKKFRQTLDVTDIIRNCSLTYKQLNKDLHTPNSLSLLDGYGDLILEYWIELRMHKNGSPLTIVSSKELVANVYRYPNRSKYANLEGNDQFYNYNLDAFKNSYSLLLQGYKYNQYQQSTRDKFALVPKYPCKSTENFGWGVSFGYGTNIDYINLLLYNTTFDYDDEISLITYGAGLYSNTWVSSLGSFLEEYFYEIEESGVPFTNLCVDYINSSNLRFNICEFESCYARYYLQWVDRFGCIQCLPFRDNITYSEDFNNEEAITYEDKRKVSHINILSKWKLNSGWIKDELYPYYESIFTSPFLILYDTEIDKNFEVIVTGNYIEKNYKNQKGLVNLELNLEAAEEQNITY